MNTETWTITESEGNTTGCGERVTIALDGRIRTGYIDSIRQDGTYLVRTRTTLVAATRQPVRTMLQAKREREAAERAALLEQIAKRHIPNVDTLEERKSDSLDFHDIHVACLKAALEAAYQAGKRAGQGRDE